MGGDSGGGNPSKGKNNRRVSRREREAAEVKAAAAAAAAQAAKETDDECRGDDRPFQRLHFLVRDWQNFIDEEDTNQMLYSMPRYLEEVLGQRAQKDLREVREHIASCFESVACFLLPHPGFAVAGLQYDGSVSKVREPFRRLLNAYVRRVFR